MYGYHRPDGVVEKEIPYLNSVFLLGTGNDGPVNQPKQITSPEQAVNVFGTEGTLYKGFLQGYSKYPDLNYFLVKVSGSYAKLTYYALDEATSQMCKCLILRSKGAAVKYNEIKIVIENLSDNKEIVKWALVFYPQQQIGEPIAYYLDIFPTFIQLVQAINRDTDAGNNFVYANTLTPFMNSISMVGMNLPEQYLSGGNDGTSLIKDDLYLALHTTYEILGGRGINLIVPLGVYFDDVYDPSYYGSGIYGESGYTSNDDVLMLYDTVEQKRCSFHEQLIDFCRNQETSGFVTHGVIGLRPFKEELLNRMQDLGYFYTSRLLQVTAFNDRLGLSEVKGSRLKDKGWYISIFAGDFLFQEGFENEYWDNGAVIYAGMLAKSSMTNHTTNMPVPSDFVLNRDGTKKVPKYRPVYETEELKILSTMGVVACRVSPKYNLVIHNGVTPSLPSSDMHDVINVKMVQYTLWFLNNFFKRYKGRTIPRDWAVLHKEITEGSTKVLEELKKANAILNGSLLLDRTTATWWRASLKLAGKYTTQDIEVPMEVNLASGST